LTLKSKKVFNIVRNWGEEREESTQLLHSYIFCYHKSLTRNNERSVN